MIRPTAPTAAVLMTAALAVSLLTAAPASAEAVDLDWYFQDRSGSGPTSTFDDAGRLDEGSVTFPLSCDTNRDGDRPTTVVDGSFTVSTDAGDVTTRFGRALDLPLCGDWDGDGLDTPGVRRGSTAYLASSTDNGGGQVLAVQIGREGDGVLTGDWDGDGDDTVALLRGNTFYAAADNVTGGGTVVSSAYGGRFADTVTAGKFTGPDGADTLAVVRTQDKANAWYVSLDRIGSRPVLRSQPVTLFGRCSDFPIAGSVDVDAPAQLGSVRLDPLAPGFVCG